MCVNESRANAPWKSMTWSKDCKKNTWKISEGCELLKQCDQVTTLVEYFEWLQLCECIEWLEELCRTKRLLLITYGHRQSMMARIARLAGAKLRRFVSGGYVSSNERSLVWKEIEAAFDESHVLTGAVVNVDYIEPRWFLENAKEIVLERVRDAVERHGSVKVNTVFNGEFATKDKHANKSIIIKTRDISIHRFAWMVRHRAYPSIARRVPGTRQWIGIVTYIEFDQRE